MLGSNVSTGRDLKDGEGSWKHVKFLGKDGIQNK